LCTAWADAGESTEFINENLHRWRVRTRHGQRSFDESSSMIDPSGNSD
jgi:hypothetical protein